MIEAVFSRFFRMANSHAQAATISEFEQQQRVFVRYAFWSCAAVVLVLSLLPGEKIPLPRTGWDKADQLLADAAMAALGCLGWAGRNGVVLVALLAFGIAIEGLQAMTGYRAAELNDVWAEVLGVGIGAGVGGMLGSVMGRGAGVNRASEGALTEDSRPTI